MDICMDFMDSKNGIHSHIGRLTMSEVDCYSNHLNPLPHYLLPVLRGYPNQHINQQWNTNMRTFPLPIVIIEV
ncbi:hypothetical protein T06_7214 [Trichinella sp. T6]|nr:hypothetical protein T06_7214 [Trichinella sp. T6]